MSQGARLLAARSALATIERNARAGIAAEVLADIARLGLETSGGDPDVERARRERDAERKRTSRGHPPHVRADMARTIDGHEGGEGGGVISDLENRERDHTHTVGVQGEGPMDVHADIVRTARGHVETTRDGAFGMSVDAWCDGVRLATGQPCTRPLPRVVAMLADALSKHCPEGIEIVDWSRDRARHWASGRKGRELSPFPFVAWLNSGSPPAYEPGSGVRRVGEAIGPPAPPVKTTVSEAEYQEHARLTREMIANGKGGGT